ncbi:MAG TPA: HRDC domain-containing protein, partial [Leptospiraceae bacterium]|nr:HRDC domain-containing protein [Leptospiraceae bacterium]
NEVHWHKFPNIDKFTPEQRRNIFDILHFRDDKARRMNKAPFRILNNETIEKIVKKEMPEENFINILGKKDGAELSRILQNPSGAPLDKADFPKPDYDLKPEEETPFKQLRKWRDKIMKKRNMDHTMLLSNKNLIQIIRSNVSTLEELRNLSLISEWKIQNYGPSILKALKNEPYDDLINPLVPLLSSRKPKKPQPHQKQKTKDQKKEEKTEQKAESEIATREETVLEEPKET